MQSKLHIIAETFVRELGSDIGRYTFVFPNHRAGLFFRKYIAKYIQKPMFSPRTVSINDCFAELSELQVTDQLTLLLRLYSIYQQLHPKAESLDRFIYWGKMMLSDFSEIDNHMVPHVEALYASVVDLHTIEERFSYLSENQRNAIARFWKEYVQSESNHPNSRMHQHFLHTWDLLYPLYTALRENLLQDGLAYEGMLHREVLAHWDEIPKEKFSDEYVFIGFNALTNSERELMLRLQDMGKADFYFDYDSPFLCDPQNKASLFMEENLRLFHSRYQLPEPTNEWKNPLINLVSVASTVGEAHEVHRILTECLPSESEILTRTAVVLPEEQLLVALLNAFPVQIDKINVTMGYPLRATPMYLPVAYPEQVLDPMPDTAADFIANIRNYLLRMRTPENSEATYQLCKVLDRLDTVLHTYTQIHFTREDIHQLLKMLTLESTIPYVGEPLEGLQVMGVLETRALEFENVIITGFNDELYPGRSHNNSFIPYTLRNGFGMPTPERQDAIFAYNFYRMLSYASHVWLLYNTSADDMHSGEASRYLHQLQLQYGVAISKYIVTNASLHSASTECKPIAKDERVAKLSRFSASALTTYLRCQKSFYYKYIEHLSEPEPDESISASEKTIGVVLHAIMQYLYAPLEGKMVTASDIEHLLNMVNDDTYWFALPQLADLQGDTLAVHVTRTYARNLLTYDYQYVPFQYIQAEARVTASLPLKNGSCNLSGFIDRVDLKSNIWRIIDYKTGTTDLIYESMSSVFGVVQDDEYAVRHKGNAQILQTLLYCWMLGPQYTTMQPCVFPARKLVNLEAITHIHTKTDTNPILFNEQIKEEFEEQLTALVEEIYDTTKPFHPTTDSRNCEKCCFAQLCEA